MRRSCAYVWRNDVASGQAGLLLRGGCVRDVGYDPVNKFTEERLLEENLSDVIVREVGYNIMAIITQVAFTTAQAAARTLRDGASGSVLTRQ
jgi:hypothetical protein